MEAAREKRRLAETEIKGYGSELAYLKAVKPEIYQSRFQETGEIQSGTEATRVAVVLFAEKFFSFQWADLGLSLYLLSLSVITSTIAILQAIAYSDRDDVQMSKSETVIKARNVFINEIISDLDEKRENSEDQKLLNLFFDELYRTGRCDYPAFVDYVKYALEMEKSRALREDLDLLETALKQVMSGCNHLKDSSSEPEIASARNLIHQGSDSIKGLAGRYLHPKRNNYFHYTDEDWRVHELIKTVEYVQDYLQYLSLTLPLSNRQVNYIEELSETSIHLTDRLDRSIAKKYKAIVGSN